MKNQIAFAIIITAVSLTMAACETAAPIINTAKNTVDNAKNTLTKTLASAGLDADTVTKAAYPAYKAPVQAPAVKLSNYFTSLPYKQLSSDELAFFHPAIEYKNMLGQQRYLVIVEKVNFYDGYILGCRACTSTADLFLFKKQGGYFQLINTAYGQTEMPGSDGHMRESFMLDLKKNLQPFGSSVMGSYSLATYSGAGGQENSMWYAVLLPDTGKMQFLEIGTAGGSTASYYAGKPQFAYTQTSTLKVINNQKTYFPLEVTYTDDVQPKKITQSMFIYDSSQQLYQERKLKK